MYISENQRPWSLVIGTISFEPFRNNSEYNHLLDQQEKKQQLLTGAVGLHVPAFSGCPRGPLVATMSKSTGTCSEKSNIWHQLRETHNTNEW